MDPCIPVLDLTVHTKFHLLYGINWWNFLTCAIDKAVQVCHPTPCVFSVKAWNIVYNTMTTVFFLWIYIYRKAMFSQVNGQQNADFFIYSMSGKNFIEKSIGVVFCVASGLSFRHFFNINGQVEKFGCSGTRVTGTFLAYSILPCLGSVSSYSSWS